MKNNSGYAEIIQVSPMKSELQEFDRDLSVAPSNFDINDCQSYVGEEEEDMTQTLQNDDDCVS